MRDFVGEADDANDNVSDGDLDALGALLCDFDGDAVSDSEGDAIPPTRRALVWLRDEVAVLLRLTSSLCVTDGVGPLHDTLDEPLPLVETLVVVVEVMDGENVMDTLFDLNVCEISSVLTVSVMYGVRPDQLKSFEGDSVGDIDDDMVIEALLLLEGSLVSDRVSDCVTLRVSDLSRDAVVD